jgi:hypothetical protein
MRAFETILTTTALLAAMALVPTANAQVVVRIGVPPVCSYGYYDYAPYACAPVGFYGRGYFYNGIFIGMGPWSGWGYSHGWGSHRFSTGGGGRYTGGGGAAANHRYAGGPSGVHADGRAGVSSRAVVAHAGPSHGAFPATASRGGASHPVATHGGESHPGGGAHGGGSQGGESHGGGEHH